MKELAAVQLRLDQERAQRALVEAALRVSRAELRTSLASQVCPESSLSTGLSAKYASQHHSDCLITGSGTAELPVSDVPASYTLLAITVNLLKSVNITAPICRGYTLASVQCCTGSGHAGAQAANRSAADTLDCASRPADVGVALELLLIGRFCHRQWGHGA